MGSVAPGAATLHTGSTSTETRNATSNARGNWAVTVTSWSWPGRPSRIRPALMSPRSRPIWSPGSTRALQRSGCIGGPASSWRSGLWHGSRCSTSSVIAFAPPCTTRWRATSTTRDGISSPTSVTPCRACATTTSSGTRSDWWRSERRFPATAPVRDGNASETACWPSTFPATSPTTERVSRTRSATGGS